MPYELPIREEIRQSLDRIQRFLGYDRPSFARLMGYTPKRWSDMLNVNKGPVSPALAKHLRETALELIRRELDPAYGPVAGLEKEWFLVVQSLRDYLAKDIIKSTPLPPPERPRSDKKAERRRTRTRYVP